MDDHLICECGAKVAFMPEDRGAEVYCPSCGRAVTVPAESPAETQAVRAAPSTVSVPATPGRAARGNIFSDRGLAELGQRIVGHCDCLCGTRIPTRLEDQGSSVYCPSCGSEVAVGRSLIRQDASVAHATEEGAAESTPAINRAAGRAWRWWVAGVGLLVAVATGAVLMARSSGDGSGVEGWSGWLGATLGGGDQGRATVKQGATERSAATAVAAPTEAAIEPSITLEAIGRLLEQSDAAPALLQAEVWRERLTAANAPKGDPRLSELSRVIKILIARQSPAPPAPPPYVAEFQRGLKTAAQALQASDLAAARSALTLARKLLDAHPELAHRGQRLEQLEQSFAQREASFEGISPLSALLASAGSSARAGRVTEGLQALAAVRWQALATPLNDLQAREIEKQMRSVAARLKLAQGRRAIEDAEACAKAGDGACRDEQLARARSMLPGLPEKEIRPLLNRAEKVEQKPVSRKAGSAVAEDIAARDRFEAAVDLVGRADPLALADAAREFLAGAHSEKWSRWLRDAVLDSWLAELDALAAGQEDQAARGRSAVREALQTLDVWRDDARWDQLERRAQAP